MAMAVDRNLDRAFTVSADHLVCRYDLSPSFAYPSVHQSTAQRSRFKSFSTGQIGNASIAVSANGAVVAVGGWDGRSVSYTRPWSRFVLIGFRIRLFSSTSLKPLGVLSFHRETVHCLAFTNTPPPTVTADDASTVELGLGTVDDDEKDEDGNEEEGLAENVPPRSRWLASGGKDKRVGLWGLKDFGRANGRV